MKKSSVIILSVCMVLFSLSTSVFAQTEIIEVNNVTETLGQQVVNMNELVQRLDGSFEEIVPGESTEYTLLDQTIEIHYNSNIVIVNGEQESFLTSESTTKEILPQWGFEVDSARSGAFVPVEFIERVLDVEIVEQSW